MVDTAQNRTKTYLDTYWTGVTRATKDDNITIASAIIAFDWPDYPLTRVFIDKDVDGIVSVGQSTSEAILDSNHYPIGYLEKVPITLCTLDKAGVTGVKLLEKMEAQLRAIFEANPLGSLRRETGHEPKTTRLGSWFMHSSQFTLTYKKDLT